GLADVQHAVVGRVHPVHPGGRAQSPDECLAVELWGLLRHPPIIPFPYLWEFPHLWERRKPRSNSALHRHPKTWPHAITPPCAPTSTPSPAIAPYAAAAYPSRAMATWSPPPPTAANPGSHTGPRPGPSAARSPAPLFGVVP